MFRLFHFLALFGYLNMLCYEVNTCGFFGTPSASANETFVEVVLEEVLNLNHAESDKNIPSIVFDDYRTMGFFLGILPAIMIFAWLFSRAIKLLNTLDHPFYFSKTQCLPGYYNFLYRYRPF
ncbi:hypothetical protein ACP6L2_12055 [Sphingobacterium lactis]|uniref:hypothetical protein n=1 Tax=Sphingobacterium lactis TaxID=797291 RepID=UPI003F8167D4